MLWGILIVAAGIVCYGVHAVLLNHYLRKNAPEVLDRESTSRQKGKVVVLDSVSPPWVALIGVPAIPLFLSGVVVILVTLILRLLR